jgi:hypothetical protein
MKKRRLWLGLVGSVLVVIGVVVILWEPTAIVRGFLAGDPFYRDRPLRYWREVLREQGRAGHISEQTVRQFSRANEVFPVLSACARDPDRNVRWPALAVLNHSGLRNQHVLDLLIEALQDEDLEIRLKAISGLASWGSMARPAMPALAERLHDPELQAAHLADLALWEIDPKAAPEICGWHPFASAAFHFSAQMPAEPKQDEFFVWDGQVDSHTFMVQHQVGPYHSPTHYIVQVSDYPEEFIQETTEEERFRALKDSAPMFTNGEIVKDKEISLGEHRGREYLLEVKDKGFTRCRHFWVGRRRYAAMVVYAPKFVNAAAADYFLDSFRLEEKPAMQAKPDAKPARSFP